MILADWTFDHSEKFQKDTFMVNHNLLSTGLFSDEALIDLLNRHPRDHLDVCTHSDHPVYQYKFRTGDVRDVKGETILEAVKAGSIWINMRKAMNIHPEYKAVLDEMYGEIAQNTGKKPYNANGGILISSPIAKVPMHFDATETILWHIRGTKRIFFYPNTTDFLADEDYETYMFRRSEDYLPYQDSMKEAATVYDLHEGDMVTWPLNTPHHVENLTYCISVTTEYSTFESSVKNAGMYTNAVLRHKLGLNPNWQRASKPQKYIKAGAGLVLRKIGVLDTLDVTDVVDFKLDKSLPGYIRDIEPFTRAF